MRNIYITATNGFEAALCAVPGVVAATDGATEFFRLQEHELVNLFKTLFRYWVQRRRRGRSENCTSAEVIISEFKC